MFLSDRAVARRYAVSRNTVWRWVREGHDGFPPPVHLSPKCTRWSLSDLEKWEGDRALADAIRAVAVQEAADE